MVSMVLWTIAYSPKIRRPSRLATAILIRKALPWLNPAATTPQPIPVRSRVPRLRSSENTAAGSSRGLLIDELLKPELEPEQRPESTAPVSASGDLLAHHAFQKPRCKQATAPG